MKNIFVFFSHPTIQNIKNQSCLTPTYPNFISRVIYYLIIAILYYIIFKNIIHYGFELILFFIEKFKLTSIFRVPFLQIDTIKKIKFFFLSFNQWYCMGLYGFYLFSYLPQKIYFDHEKIYILRGNFFSTDLEVINYHHIQSIHVYQPLYKKFFFLSDIIIQAGIQHSIKNVVIHKKELPNFLKMEK